VVAGSVGSYEVWVRALDPGEVTSAGAPPGVRASGESKVPALITLSPKGKHASRHATSHGAASRIVLLPVAAAGPTSGIAAILPSARVRPVTSGVVSGKSKPAPVAPHGATPQPVVPPTPVSPAPVVPPTTPVVPAPVTPAPVTQPATPVA